MPLLLDAVYLLLLALASPWLAWQSIRKGKYRKAFPPNFSVRVPPPPPCRRCVWLHAVSVGEVNLLLPLVAEIERRWPGWECVISTTTRTGFALARERFPQAIVSYCPLDFSWAVRQAVERIRPDVLVLAELELWPNLIAAARRSGARVAIVNGRLSERSFRGYRRIRPLIARFLAQVDLVAVQTPEYAERFRQLGALSAAVHVTGSIKFDGAQTDRGNRETIELQRLAGIAQADVVLLAGSTQAGEEELALAALRRWTDEFPRLKLILVPRHPERFAAVAAMLSSAGVRWLRRTELTGQPPDSQARVLLVDKIGELRSWWGCAQIAFVGGSLGPRGGQNMIEPAAYGAAVSFGPNTQNFRDVVALLLAADAAVVVHDGHELSAFIGRCLNDPAFAAGLGERAAGVVGRQLGATRRTVDLLSELRPSASHLDRDVMNAA
jgi:3-deoxy-D-manno-octulosonic-acid transferase